MLVFFDVLLNFGHFRALCAKVHASSVRRDSPGKTSEQICRAIDVACIWYWKRVLCLQRSAVAVCLLRTYGLPAEMVIGVQQTPFKAHAWVEVDGMVVNDKPYTAEMYAVLDRC
jgi:hypothetical protein